MRQTVSRSLRGALSLLAAALLLGGGMSALAADNETADDERFADKSWEELVEALVKEVGGSEKTVALGYCNTVTGEEHYYNADSYFVGASLYKAPLNMYYSEQVALGTYSWEDTILDMSYADAQVSSLTYSNNPRSEYMVKKLGGWRAFRAAIAPYMGADPADEDYLARGHHFTARQMTACMTLLAREPERFPNVTQCLLDSAPGKFLEYADVPYEIAQKYGNVGEEKLFHAAGIVFTDEPIALVVLTSWLGDQRGIMAGYTQLMCDYTQYHTARRLAQEAEAAQKAQEAEAERLAREAEEAKRAQEAADQAAAQLEAERLALRETERESARQEAERLAARAAGVRRALWIAGIAAGALLAVLLLLSLCGRLAVRPGALLATALCLALVLGALALAAVNLRLPAQSASGGAAALSSPGALFSSRFTDGKSQALQGLAFVEKTYSLPENLTVAPRPSSGAFGSTTDPAVIEQLVADAAALLDGQTLVWTADTELAPNTDILYYRDDTILTIIWKERIGRRTVTFAEVKIADASQLRRKLADDSYGAALQKFPSELARDSNAVVAINGDFYRFQKEGIHVYERKVYRADSKRLDTCFFDTGGNMIFSKAGELTGEAAAQQFVDEHDILFSVSFGPVMVENGVNVTPEYYWYGQARDIYARACLAQMDTLHYLLATVYIGDTVSWTADMMIAKGCTHVYAVDGGQSATIVLDGKQVNPSQFDSERTLSDIIYFASAIPEGKGD